jgi:hypothetical protein
VILVIVITSTVLNFKVNNEENFRVPLNVSVVYFGHSQAACAYNDSLIRNFRNYAGSMEGYFYTYYKLKKTILSNPHIKTVFVECTNNQFEKFAENRIWGKYMPSLSPKYMPVLDAEGLLLLGKKSPLAFTKAFSASQKLKIEYLIGNDENYFTKNKIAGYTWRKTSFKQEKIDSIILRNNNPEFKKDKTGYSPDNIFYLKQIVDFCELNNVNVYFVRSPMPSFLQITNDSLFRSVLTKEFRHTTFIDLKDYPLANKDFNDNIHLNYMGAMKLSKFMDRFIASGAFKTDTFQKWIDVDIQKDFQK